MFSPETIRDMAHEAGDAAQVAGDTPFVYWRGDPPTAPFPFPNLGDFRPDGWEMVDTLFVDMTGWGGETEPALTPGQLMTRLSEIRQPYEETGQQVGFAIVETGQFQAVLGVFERTTMGPEAARLDARARAGLGEYQIS